MNGKKLLSLTLALLISLPVTAYAQGNGKSENSHGKGQQAVQTDKVQGQSNVKDATVGQGNTKGDEHKQEAMQKKEDKKQQIEAFKTQIRDKHDQMKDIKLQTIELKKQISQKREQLSAIVNEIISGEKTLSEDMLNQLLAVVQNLGKDVEQVSATAEVSGDVSSTQTEVNNGEFNNALTSLGGVVTKLQSRLEALNKLSADLDAALAIANLAAAPAPTPAPGPVTGDTQQTPGTTDQTTTGDITQTPGTTDQTTTGDVTQTPDTTGVTQAPDTTVQ